VGNSAINVHPDEVSHSQEDIANSSLSATEASNESSATEEPDAQKTITIWNRLGLSRRKRYILAAVLNLTFIWGSTISFIALTPDVFVSKFTLLIPGSGTGSSLNLDNLGQASTSVNSAYSSSKVDPKTNYKAIAMSPVVIERAAYTLGIDSKDFGKPKIKLVDQTTLLEITLTASAADSAYNRSRHFHNALEQTLNQLRTEELSIRRTANESVLSEYQKNVKRAQAAVLAFQQESTIVSSEQFNDFVSNVESLKQRRADSSVRLTATDAQLSELENTLNINSLQAADAIKLQNDAVFMSLAIKVAKLHSELVEKNTVWGRNHPKVKHARAQVDESKSALLDRAKQLTDIEQYKELNQLYINGENSRSNLFQNMILLSAEKFSIAAEVESYTAQITSIEKRLLRNASLAAKLQDLERTHQVATAIYVSAAAKTDLGNSDIYASYPMMQMLMAPTRPSGPQKFTKVVAIAGALVGSLLICLALLISWKRSVLLQKLQKRS